MLAPRPYKFFVILVRGIEQLEKSAALMASVSRAVYESQEPGQAPLVTPDSRFRTRLDSRTVHADAVVTNRHSTAAWRPLQKT